MILKRDCNCALPIHFIHWLRVLKDVVESFETAEIYQTVMPLD